jgi:acetoin utilization deacetylase AcuC-like enzyme
MRRLGRTLEAPLGCVLEGGYGLDALARSVAATLTALQEPLPAERAVAGADGDASPLVGAALERLSEWWPQLAV